MPNESLKLRGAWLGLSVLSVVSPTLRRSRASRGVRAALAWMRRGDRGVWPTVEDLELDVELSPPGGFEAEARLELSGIEGAAFGLLLNRGLRITRAVDGEGRVIRFLHGSGLPGRQHSEARLVLFLLERSPAAGRATLRLHYEGRGASGSEGPDWRGILLVDEEQVRMTEQSVFYPAVPLSGDGPALGRSPATLRVHAPPELEVAAPGRRTADRPRWTFELRRRGVLCLVAGRLSRFEADVEGSPTTVLLRPEHARLAPELAAEVRAILGFYRSWLGAVDTGPVTVVEIACRSGSSYNWASEGVVAIDRRTLRGELPLRLLAHELAHLWWGLGVRSEGPGERFLTESTAEYACWRFLEQRRGPEALAELEERARERVAALQAGARDVPLRDVTFRTPGYADLVHGKGPLALRGLEASIGRSALDRALRGFVERHAERVATLEELLAAVRDAAGEAEPRFESVVG